MGETTDATTTTKPTTETQAETTAPAGAATSAIALAPTPVQRAETEAKNDSIGNGSGQSGRPYHGPLGQDVIYIATASDAQSGIEEGQPLAGKIVKVIADDEVNRILVCNLDLFAADSAGLVFKPNVEMGIGEGKFLFS